MRSLFVLLPMQAATAATQFDYVLSSDGRHVQQHGSAAAALLPQPTGAGAQVVAIAPARALSWHRVELPKGSSTSAPRLRAVLEGLLEDRLLDEPDALHFALGPDVPAGAPQWVAVCDRAWLRSAVQVLEAAQRPVSRIVPEFAPEGSPVLHVQSGDGNATVVAVSADGVMLLPLGAPATPLLATLAADAPLVADPSAAALAEQVLGRPAVLRHPGEQWLTAAQSSWDLAQLEFASSGQARTLRRLVGGWAALLHAPHWRPARVAVLLLLLVQLAGLNAWAWKERAALQAKRDAVREVLTTSFPQVKVVVDAPVQMERAVAGLRQAAGAVSGRDLESMLAALAATAPPGLSPAGLEFDGTELRVRGMALQGAQAQELAVQLRGLGYSARQQADALVLTQEATP